MSHVEIRNESQNLKENPDLSKQENTKQTISPPTNGDGGDINNKNNNTSVFITDLERDQVIKDLGPSVPIILNSKVINGMHDEIDIKSQQEFINWVGLSSEVLKSNKLVVEYDMTTATNDTAKALGKVKPMAVDTTACDYVVSRQYDFGRLVPQQEQVTLQASLGFPVVHKKIDDLLVARLTDSLGKQSPENGKVFDMRSILNANMLPVIKNGSIGNTHRIFETLCEMLAVYKTTTNDTTPVTGEVSLYNCDDLARNDVREIFTNPTTYSYGGKKFFKDVNLVSKAINPMDGMNDVKALTYGALQATQCNGQRLINIYCGALQPDLSFLSEYMVTNYLDLSNRAIPGYWSTVPFCAFRDTTDANDVSGKIIYQRFRGYPYVITPTNAEDKDTIYEILSDYLEKNGTAATYALINTGTVTIGSGDDAVTYTWSTGSYSYGPTIKRLYTAFEVNNYCVYENYADIINAIDIISKLRSTWKTNSDDGTHPVNKIKTVRATVSGPRLFAFIQSSMFARIGMYYGQLEYKNNMQRYIGDQTLISNKVFNYSYYLAGLMASGIKKFAGSFKSADSYLPVTIRDAICSSLNVVHFKYDTISHHIPLFSYNIIDITDTDRFCSQRDYDGTGYLIADYFTLPRWWRYDYFGGVKSLAPNQRLTMNAIDQDYSEDSDEVFINTTQQSSNTEITASVVGNMTFRFTPNGAYTPINLVSISYCPNTTIRFKIPKLFKNKKRVKCVLLHGLDLLTNASPIWYGPYDAKYTLEDDGSFDEDLIDQIF